MIDNAGEKPKLLSKEISVPVMDLLVHPTRMLPIEHILGGKRYIRRAQLNKMPIHAFLGKHLDIESNPDYDAAIVIQLGKEYTGGEFVAYPSSSAAQSIKTAYWEITVTRCDLLHEVKRVTSGSRIVLAYFLSSKSPDAVNQRQACSKY